MENIQSSEQYTQVMTKEVLFTPSAEYGLLYWLMKEIQAQPGLVVEERR